MASARGLRSLAAAAPAAATILLAWSFLERPVSWGAFVALALLALVPALPLGNRGRISVGAGAVLAALTLAFETWPHRALQHGWAALHDAPAVQAPFDPLAFPTLHGLVACTGFGLALAAVLGVVARRPTIVVAAVTVGVGFPATLLEDAYGFRLGMLALGSVLWAFVVLRSGRLGRAVPGVSARGGRRRVRRPPLRPGASPRGRRTSTGVAGIRSRVAEARGDFRFVWDANYAGISFPARPTVVFRVRAPQRAQYWRASTLDTFVADRWIENLYPVDAGTASGRLPADPLVPERDRRPGSWLHQQVTIDGYEDDHVVAAGAPALVDGRALGRVSFLSGGVMRAATPVQSGTTYSVWSYAPEPSPRALAASPARYPAAADRYLELDRAQFLGYGTAVVSGASRRCSATTVPAAMGVPAPVARCAADHVSRPFAVRGDAAARALVPLGRELHVRRAAAAVGGAAAARRLRRADAGGLLPALRRGDDRDASHARRAGTRRRRVHGRHVEGWRLDSDGLPGARMGRGVVRRLRLADLRPDSRAGHALRRLHARVRLRRTRWRRSAPDRFLDFDQAPRHGAARLGRRSRRRVGREAGIAWWIVALPFVPLARRRAGMVGAKLSGVNGGSAAATHAARLGSAGGLVDALVDRGLGVDPNATVASCSERRSGRSRRRAGRSARRSRRRGTGPPTGPRRRPDARGTSWFGSSASPARANAPRRGSERSLAPVVPPALDTFGKVRW